MRRVRQASTRYHAAAPRTHQQRSAISLALVLGLLASLLLLAPARAWANGTVGSFEIDGNLVDDPAGEPMDWSTPPPNLIDFADATVKGDDVFNTGSKQLAAGQWDCRVGSALDKSDIQNGQVASRVVDGDQFLYVNFTRVGVNGDAHVDYEFNQSAVPNPSCPSLPSRTTGDLLIAFDTDTGGKVIQVRVFKYTGDASSGTFAELPAAEHSIWDGAVNIPNSIVGHKAGDFGEASLNLTDSPIGTIACGQFAKIYMKTRASTAIESALKDRTAAQPVNLGCPDSALAKAVRNVTADGGFANSTTAAPGDTLEYQLSYSNSGTGDATNVVVTDNIEAKQTYLSCTEGCTTNGPPVTTVRWNLGVVPANTTKAVTFQVVLDETFPVGATTIENTGTVKSDQETTPEPSNTTTVTVDSTIVLGLVKSLVGEGTQFSRGDDVTYSLAYSNTGNSTATDVVITETIPANTTYVSCTSGCITTGSPVSTVIWNVGSVPAGGSGIVTMTVQVTSDVACQICNVATIAAAGVASTPSNQVCITVVPVANADGAKVTGSALGASVSDTLLGLDRKFSEVSTGSESKHGLADYQNLGFRGVEFGPLRASLLEVWSFSWVQGSRAFGFGEATAANVDVLSGTIRAKAVRAVANTTANGTASSYNSTGSAFEDLVVNGAVMNNVAPNTRVDLPGIGYAVLYEEIGETSSPTGTSGGTYSADVTVNMIHVYVQDALGVETGEIIVSQVKSHSEFPQTTVCLANPTQSVSGHAFIGSEVTDPLVAPVMFGYVDIPASGGVSHQHVDSVMLPPDGSGVKAGTSTSDTWGEVVPGSRSTSSSYAEASQVCVLKSDSGCTISATAVRSQANSSATRTGASSDDKGTKLIDLVVAGVPVADTPDPNTVIELPGIGFLVLNEQVCDGGTRTNTHTCPGPNGSTGITVRAIHVVVHGIGGDIIVAEAHADSTYR